MVRKSDTRVAEHRKNRFRKSLKRNWKLRILSVVLALGIYAYVQVSSEVERVIRVPITVPELPGDLVFAEKIPDFLNISLSGQANDLDFDVSRYQILLEIDNFTIGDTEFRSRLVPAIPEGVKVRYRRKFDLKIEQAFRRELPVIPIVQLNQNQSELEIQKVFYTLIPPTILVYGSYAALKKLDRLPTKTVYLSARSVPTQKRAILADLPDQVFMAQKQKILLNAYGLTEGKEIDGVRNPKIIRLDSSAILCANPITNLSMKVNSEPEVSIYLRKNMEIQNVWIQCPAFTDGEGSIIPSSTIRNLPIFVDREVLGNLLFMEPQTVDVTFQLINPL